MKTCGTPYCGTVEESWCYCCKMVVTNCGCGFWFSTCLCNNPQNWLAVGEHKAKLVRRRREKLTRDPTSEEAQAKLDEALAIGNHPPVKGSYLQQQSVGGQK